MNISESDNEISSMNKRSDYSGKRSYIHRILVPTSEKIIFIDAEDIYWVASTGNYVNLHLYDETYLIRGTLKKIESKLDPDEFVRIHRSHIVNINRISSISPLRSGDYKVELQEGKELKMSRNYKDNLNRFKVL